MGKNWRNALIAVAVLALLAIGGTVWWGVVQKPVELKAKNIAACETFNTALGEAYKEQTVTDFYFKLFRASYAGIDNSTDGSELNDAFITLSKWEAIVAEDQSEEALQSVGMDATHVQAVCAGLLGVSVQSPTPSS